jgi:hypothetical protein
MADQERREAVATIASWAKRLNDLASQAGEEMLNLRVCQEAEIIAHHRLV